MRKIFSTGNSESFRKLIELDPSLSHIKEKANAQLRQAEASEIQAITKCKQLEQSHQINQAELEKANSEFEIAKEALRLAAQKLPVTTKFVVRRDYDFTSLNA